AVSQRDAAALPGARAVRPAPPQRLTHPADRGQTWVPPVQPNLTREAAHVSPFRRSRPSMSVHCTIQVSLAPPPREEFTIMVPAGATRVSGAGTTTGVSP